MRQFLSAAFLVSGFLLLGAAANAQSTIRITAVGIATATTIGEISIGNASGAIPLPG